MTDGLLENIIQLEKQIQADIADEEVRAKVWQERELAQLGHTLEAARTDEEERCRQELKDREAELQRDVARLEAETEGWCARLAALNDATLSKVLRSKLAAVLPGGDHDHPHGQG